MYKRMVISPLIIMLLITLLIVSCASPAPAPAPAPAPVAAPPVYGLLPMGTVVSVLPAGCQTMTTGGVEYYHCSDNYFRSAFQGNELVYVAATPE